MISPSLAGVRPDGDLTPEQFENALQAVGDRTDEAVLRRLGLSDAERVVGRDVAGPAARRSRAT